MTTGARLHCYGLTIDSAIALPDLGSGPAGTTTDTDGAAPADVTIRRGRVPAPGPSADLLPLGLWRDHGVIGLRAPGVASYLVRDGSEIVVDAEPDADQRTVSLFLLGTAMGALMMQRGHLVLHGNAFRVGDACAVVVGRSGAGKSTLAAELQRRGHDVLADDVVPVDDAGNALPGYPRIKLWEDAVARLDLDSSELQRVARAVDKFELPIARNAIGPLPLRWVYVLERHEGDGLMVTRATGMETFDLLHEHTYRNELVHGEDAVRAHLAQCAQLARRARISRITRPAATMTAQATADAILSDIMSGTPSSKEIA